MLKTFSVTGTKTPAKVPSLSVPPTGLGNAPGLGLAVSVAERCLPFSALGCAMSKMLQNQRLMASTPCSSGWTLELCSPPSGSSGVSSFGGDEMCTEERRCSRSAASVAVRAAKLERALGSTGRAGCPGLASAMVQVVLQQQLGMCMVVCPADKTRRWCAYRWGSGQSSRYTWQARVQVLEGLFPTSESGDKNMTAGGTSDSPWALRQAREAMTTAEMHRAEPSRAMKVGLAA
jgi:hypothetical protein